MNNFEQLCQVRRSVRAYTNQPIEQEKIDYMLRCALMSPSAKRTCPWEFYVTTDEAKLRPLSGCRRSNAPTAQCGCTINATNSKTPRNWSRSSSGAFWLFLPQKRLQGSFSLCVAGIDFPVEAFVKIRGDALPLPGQGLTGFGVKPVIHLFQLEFVLPEEGRA